MRRSKKTRIAVLVVFCSAAFMLTSQICSAQIDTFEYAHDKLIADIFAGEETDKEVFGNPNLLFGDVDIDTTTGVVKLGAGPGWVFFIRDSFSPRPLNELVLIKTSGKLTRRITKGEPVFLSDFVFVSQPPEGFQRPTGSVNNLTDAYTRLVDGLLGHTPGNRRIYAQSEKLAGEVTVENWREILVVGQGPGWLFFIDDNPFANWEHGCRFAVVTESGEISVVKSMTPPKDMSPFQEMTEGFPPEAQPLEGTEGNAVDLPKKDKISSAIRIGASDTPATKRWAVIISGGYNQSNNHIRYWNDCSYFYKTLMANGFRDQNIYVLISDGTDPAVDRSNGTNSPTDLDDDGDPDTQYSVTKANIKTVFDTLKNLLDGDDILYIFATSHGGSLDSAPYDDPTVNMALWNATLMNDTEFATEVNKVTTMATVCIFEPCYSGGMLDNLQGTNRVLMSAARYWELSYAKSTLDYDEFSYYLTYAFANPSIADASSDGVVSMEEGYLYALAHDSRQSELLDSGGNNMGEHPSYYSNPWYLGRKISLAGYRSAVADPVIGRYTQHEVIESFPSGGTNLACYGDDTRCVYTLPFSFPFYEETYDAIFVGTNGIIYLGSHSPPYFTNRVDYLKDKNAIAPIWDDLTVLSADGDAIYTRQYSDSVIIRWKAHTYKDDRPVQVAVKLYASGAIKFFYGPGNDHTSRIAHRDKTIGISGATGSLYHLCLRNGQGKLNNARAILYSPELLSTNIRPAVLHLLLGK